VIDPTDIGVGARPLGLGKAFTAIANDGSALFTNPAGLAQNDNLKLISMSGNLMQEVPYTLLGASYPALNGNLGLGYVGLGVSGIRETVLVNGVPDITGNEASFSNTAVLMSYATDFEKVPYLNRISTGTFKNIKIGTTLKLLSQGFDGTASFEAGNISGFDLDLGAIAEINEDTTAGLTIKNIIPGNNINEDEIPMIINAGIARRFRNYNLAMALDAEFSRGLLFHLGCEWNPIQILKLRAGLDQKPSAGSSATNLAMGLGVNYRGFTFDYAYHTYAELAEFSTHFFSLGYIGEDIKPVPKKVRPLPKPKPAPPKKKEITAEDKNLMGRIEKYITSLEGKLSAAEEPKRIERLKTLISEQKARLEAINKKYR
jgi:hypothetical protein